MSAVSDLTDITLNVKGNNFLSSDGKDGELSRTLLSHVEQETLINRTKYVQHVENSVKFATSNQIDNFTLNRSKSPVGSLRNSRNTLADKMRVDNELFAADMNTSGRNPVNAVNTSANSRLLNTSGEGLRSGGLNTSGDSGRGFRSAGLNRSNNQGTVGTMQSAQFVQNVPEDSFAYSDISSQGGDQVVNTSTGGGNTKKGAGFRLRSDFDEDTRTDSRASSGPGNSRSVTLPVSIQPSNPDFDPNESLGIVP